MPPVGPTGGKHEETRDNGALERRGRASCCLSVADTRIVRVIVLKEAAMEPDVLVHRVRAEFNEMPGLRLTLAQATRLWRLEPAVCQEIIDTLVDSHFLRWTTSGMVMRADR